MNDFSLIQEGILDTNPDQIDSAATVNRMHEIGNLWFGTRYKLYNEVTPGVDMFGNKYSVGDYALVLIHDMKTDFPYELDFVIKDNKGKLRLATMVKERGKVDLRMKIHQDVFFARSIRIDDPEKFIKHLKSL